jgi:hypothetical protein
MKLRLTEDGHPICPCCGKEVFRVKEQLFRVTWDRSLWADEWSHSVVAISDVEFWGCECGWKFSGTLHANLQ